MISRRLLAMGLLCLAGIAPSTAQHYTYLSGAILDASSASVPDALITVVNEDTGSRRTSVTAMDGGYVVSPLEPGVYKVSVRKTGFRTMIRFGVSLLESRPARVDFKLVVGSVQETITVEGSAPMLHTDDASIGTLLGRDQIERLPGSAGGGGLLDLLTLTPGLIVTPATRGESGQFTADGQRPNSHYFTVDGASANSGVSGGGVPAQSNGGALPGMTAFGSLGLVSIEALEEVQVQTSSTVPEFGRLPGAQISLTSRSGSNELHGSLLYSFRNDALDANDWFANQQGDPRAMLRLSDFAATLGGPVRRNRTFFFLSYEGLRLTQPFVWRQPVPSFASRETAPSWVQPLLNVFPAPNGAYLGNGLAQWTGSFSRPSQLDIGAVRLDQAITSNITAFARYSESPSSTEFGASPVNLLDVRSRTGTLGVSIRARPNLVFDVHVNGSSAVSDSVWQRPSAETLPSCFLQSAPSLPACNSLVRLAITGAGQISLGNEGRRSQSQFQINESAHLNVGSHSWVFGSDYRRLVPSRADAAPTYSVVADQVSDFVQIGQLWKSTSAKQNTSAVLQEFSFFGEDTWRVTPRLTAVFGLRWEISPGPMPGSAANFVDPMGNVTTGIGRLWSTQYSNFAPRLGMAFRPTASGRTVIRAGMGLYYDSSLSLATDLINDGPLNVSQSNSTRGGFVTQLIKFGFPTSLHLPLVTQWNASMEQALNDRDVLSLGYVGATGNDLIRREIGGLGSTSNVWLALSTNDGTSSYQGLEAQYRHRLANGLQALVSYSWSHSIDNSSTDSGLYWAGSGLLPKQDRGSSDFDIRHSVTAGFSYQVSSKSRIWGGWGLDGMFRARTGFPINVLDAEQYAGIPFQNIFRPDLLPGQPLWITDGSSPGGRRLNSAAFQPVSANSVQGNLGRNVLTGFGMSQLDLALRREFLQGEHRSLELRVEAFNAFNHPNFADPVPYLASPLFGQSSSMLNMMLGTGSPGSGLAPVFQTGSARSLQLTLRFRF